ncbi:MAG: hypothetical protein L6427_00395 [Actinomycetia bacterium]|nr:hypothetical protein [Actinomycetes bacterium]
MGLVTRKHIIIGILIAAVATVAVVLAMAFLLGGSPGILPLDAPGECANKPVQGKLILNVEDEDLPQTPEKMTVYCLEPIVKTEEEIHELAAKFGITDIERSHKEIDSREYDSYQGMKGDRIETCLAFGYDVIDENFNFENHAKYGRENPNLPTKDESRGIALDTLESLGLLPDEAYVSGTGGEQTETIRDGEWVKFFDHRNVIISRKLDGHYVIGPGMRIKVSLGTNGELIGLDSTMRNPVPHKEFKTKSIEDAIRDAKKGKNTMNLHPEVKDPEVTKVEILFYADPAKPENKYLQPVYCLTGPETCIYVPAIKQ